MPIKQILLDYFDFKPKDYFLNPILDEKGEILYYRVGILSSDEVYNVFTQEAANIILDRKRNSQIQLMKKEIPPRWHEFCDFDRAAKELFPEVEDLYNYIDTIIVDNILYYIGGYK